MKKLIVVLSTLALLVIIAVGSLLSQDVEETPLAKLKEQYPKKVIPSVDHSKFAILQQKFTSPQAVTKACLTCHNLRHKEVMASNHWNWESEEYIEGRGIVNIGKRNLLNNFCIGTHGNEKACAKCHIGYGLDEKGKILSKPDNIDCLICHDNTETYAKANNMAGFPDPNLDLNAIAQSVGEPKRTNCGVCHFYGGGGNNVKHGDLESAMFYPTKDVDVHMGTDATDMQCVDCHKTERHNISGKLYSLSSMNRNRVTCEQCHTSMPHDSDILNEHTIKVSCQACHIPTYAKVNSTKTFWDWSTAGKLHKGIPYTEEDSLGNHTYLSIKGSFEWGRNLTPEYVWFDGTASHYLLGDKIQDTTKPLALNQLHGSYAEHNAKIIPVKVHRANQCFDPINRIMIQPKLYGEKPGDGGFWEDFDCERAIEQGMKDLNLPYSGEYSFLHTEMYWPLNHMVSSKDKTVSCTECHTRDNGRLAKLTDFYMPGRDYSKPVEFIGNWLIILALLGIMIHGTIRIVVAYRLKKGGKK